MKLILALIPAMLTASLALAEPEKPNNPLADGATWHDLKGDVVDEAAILDGTTLFSVTAPYRANDAATVPVTIERIAQWARTLEGRGILLVPVSSAYEGRR